MKFALATVFTLALALGVQASIIPWGHHTEVAGHGLAYTAVGPAHGHAVVHGPASVAVHAAPWAGAWPGAWHDAGDWHGAWHGDWAGHHDDGQWHGDWAHGHHGAAVVVAAPHVHAHHEGTYVAKTRGAVHTAPLSGHIASAAAINVAPAPGTV